jgi:uncharacterized protein (DUF2236 family)
MQGGVRPKDDGLFGPDTITWRVFAAPASVVGASCALLVQMLHPCVVRLIDQASNYKEDPKLRRRLTRDYFVTIIYGDTKAAENAAKALRQIHSRMKAVDLETGQKYTADEPDLLLFVHNTIVWSLLRANDRWGSKLSAEERDRFVVEQHIAARLVGIDSSVLPSNVTELNEYMERTQRRLSYTLEAAPIRDLMVPRSLPRTPKRLIKWVLKQGVVLLMTPEQRELYGFRWTKLHEKAVSNAAMAILSLARAKMPYEKVLPELRAEVAAHAFEGLSESERADTCIKGIIAGGPLPSY